MERQGADSRGGGSIASAVTALDTLATFMWLNFSSGSLVGGASYIGNFFNGARSSRSLHANPSFGKFHLPLLTTRTNGESRAAVYTKTAAANRGFIISQKRSRLFVWKLETLQTVVS